MEADFEQKRGERNGLRESSKYGGSGKRGTQTKPRTRRHHTPVSMLLLKNSFFRSRSSIMPVHRAFGISSCP